MIQQIEKFRAKLRVQPLPETRVLDDREIHGVETGPFENIPPGVAEFARWRDCERCCVEPFLRAGIREARVSNYIRPLVRAEAQFALPDVGVVDRRQQRDRERLSALKRQHSEALPTAQPAMPLRERNVVGVAQHESIANIEVAQPAFGAQIVAVLRKVRVAGRRKESRRVVNRFRIRVGGEQRQPVRQPLFQTRLQAVVDRVRAGLDNIDVGEGRIGPHEIRIGRRLRLVDVTRIDQVRAFGPDVGHFEHTRFSQLLLNSEIPLLNVGRLKIALERGRRGGVGKWKIGWERIGYRRREQALNRIVDVQRVVRRAEVQALRRRKRGLIVMNPVRCANHHRAVAPRRPREAGARRDIAVNRIVAAARKSVLPHRNQRARRRIIKVGAIRRVDCGRIIFPARAERKGQV